MSDNKSDKSDNSDNKLYLAKIEKVIMMQSNIRLTLVLRELAKDYGLSFDELQTKYMQYLDNEPNAQVPFSGQQKRLEVFQNQQNNQSQQSNQRLSTESQISSECSNDIKRIEMFKK